MEWTEKRNDFKRRLHKTMAPGSSRAIELTTAADEYALALAEEVGERIIAVLGAKDPQYAGELRADVEAAMEGLEEKVRDE